MKLRIDINDIDSSRIRKVKLNEKRVPINLKEKKEIDSVLLKVKHIDNDDLFNDPSDPNKKNGGHLVLPVAYNVKNKDVGITVITSIEDSDGNVVKENQIKNGLIFNIDGHISGLRKKSGIKQEVITKNRNTNININYSMLKDTNHRISVNPNISLPLREFLFDNNDHKKKSRENWNRTTGYSRIKK